MAKAHFEKFAMNYLTATLLDDAMPPRWADFRASLICNDGSEARVGGSPVHPGELVPDNRFTLHWTLHHCGVTGDSALDMDGAIDLDVAPASDTLMAVARPHGLRVRTADGVANLVDPFTVRLALAVTH